MKKEKICGIYKIRNLVNGKIYIGSSNGVTQRWMKHRWALNKNRHENRYLQRAWNKCDEGEFVFEMVEDVDHENCLEEREQWYLDNVVKWDFDYNISRTAGRPVSWEGRSHTLETRHKMGEHQRGEDNHSSVLTDKSIVEIFNLYVSGKNTRKELGKKFRVHEGTIGGILRGESWKHVYKEIPTHVKDLVSTVAALNVKNSGNKGEICPSSKLTDKKVLKIFSLYSDGGYSQERLGKMFKVGRRTVSDILRGKTWLHIYNSMVSDDIKNKVRSAHEKNSEGISGEDNHVSKLTDKKALDIRRLHKDDFEKYTYKKLSKMFDVTKSTIGKVIRRETWKHI